MSEITRLRVNPFAALVAMFTSGPDIDNVEFNKEQQESQSNADGMMDKSSEAIYVKNGKTNKKGGIRKKYEAPEIIPAQEMTPEKLEKMSKILKGNDYEIEQ